MEYCITKILLECDRNIFDKQYQLSGTECDGILNWYDRKNGIYVGKPRPILFEETIFTRESTSYKTNIETFSHNNSQKMNGYEEKVNACARKLNYFFQNKKINRIGCLPWKLYARHNVSDIIMKDKTC